MRPTTIVVSGFEPFGAAAENPTLDVLKRLERTDGLDAIHTIRLPVEAARVTDLVSHVLHKRRPDLWIGLGLAMGSSVIAVERIGVNVLDFAIPDNAGASFAGEAIVADGPAAYLATLPVATIVEDLRARGIPAKISNSASTYLCNQMMYTLLHLIHRLGLETRAGFVHVPAHPALAARQRGGGLDMPSMSVDLMADAVRTAITTTLRSPAPPHRLTTVT